MTNSSRPPKRQKHNRQRQPNEPLSRRGPPVRSDSATAPADLPYLKAAIDQLPLPAYLKDREHTWVAMNAAFARLIGQTPEALLGHTDKEQADDAWQLDDRVLDSGKRRRLGGNHAPARWSGPHPAQTAQLWWAGAEARYVMGVVEEAGSTCAASR